MEKGQEFFILPWWSDISPDEIGLYIARLHKLIRLYDLRIKTETNPYYVEKGQIFHRLLTELLLPLAEQDGQINFGRQQIDLCVQCGLAVANLSADIRAWFITLTKPGNIMMAACLLEVSSTEVRKLILDGQLPAVKIDQEWSIESADALRLALQRAEQETL